MRIALVTEYVSSEGSAPYGGVDWREKSLARILGRNNEYTLVTSYSTGQRRETCDTYDIVRVGPRRRHVQRGDFWRRISFMRCAAEAVRRIKPDIVCGSGFVSWHPVRRCADRLRVPSVAIVHEVWRGRWTGNMGFLSGVAGSVIERPILKGFDGYVAVSRTTASDLIELGIDSERIQVVTNGVDEEFFDADDMLPRAGDPILLTVSRLIRYKRISDLLEASSLLFRDGISHRLIVIGDGPDREFLEKKTVELGISDTTKFMGRIQDRSEYIRAFKRCDVFVLPSATEGMGMVLAEAMAAGIPYVVSDIPALRETSFNGCGGYLYRPGDVRALADSISLAIKNGRVSDGYILARREYDWVKIAMQYSEFLDGLVKRKKST